MSMLAHFEAVPYGPVAALSKKDVVRRLRSMLPPVFGVVMFGIAFAFALARGASVPAMIALAGVAAWWWRSAIAERAARQQLERELDRRDRFWTHAAHDLKSHVAAVRLRAQLLERRSRRGEPIQESFAEGMADIEASAGRMATIISEMQDVARLEAGIPLRLDLAPVSLAAVAESAVAEARLRARERQIHLRIDDEARVEGMWDGRRLERVLTNLLDNALKFSPSNEDVSVSVAVEEDAAGRGWAVLKVVDRGIGIPAADLGRVFERFHRARNAESLIPGTGLGLAGSRDIVTQHGGTISVESEEYRGSTFTVRLPLERAAEPAL